MRLKLILLAVISFFVFQFTHGQETETAPDDPEMIEEDMLIEGTVVDAEDKPIKGVSIYIDSVKTRVKTNRMGEFKIMLEPSTKEVSAFSKFYGMQTLSFAGGSRI